MNIYIMYVYKWESNMQLYCMFNRFKVLVAFVTN